MNEHREADYLEALGARLTLTRNEEGVTQAVFAKAAGVSTRAYQSYEAGKRSIPAEAIYKLHCAFALDVDWILLGEKANGVGGAHQIEKLEKFIVALVTYLLETQIILKPKKTGVIVSRWYRELLNGKEIDMADVYTWIELLQE